MLVVEQQFCVCIKEIISWKPYGAKSVRKSGEYYDVIMTLTTLLIPILNQLLTEVESRTQGSRPRPRPRTQKNPRPRPRIAFSRTDPLEAKNRNARGQGQGPRTQPHVFSKKKALQKSFSGNLHFLGVARIFDW